MTDAKSVQTSCTNVQNYMFYGSLDDFSIELDDFSRAICKRFLILRHIRLHLLTTQQNKT